MRKQLIICLIVSSISMACSFEDPVPGTDEKFLKIRGTVVGTAACNTESNGPAYEIYIENLNSIERIITPTLPDQFKEEGLEIVFDMEQSQEGLSICATIYSPEVFYKVDKVSADE